MHKQKKREGEKKWLNHFEPFSFHTMEELFRLTNTWSGSEGEELKPFKFQRNMRALRKSPRGAKKGGSWFYFPDEIILLLYRMANHLQQFGRVCPKAPQWWQRWCFLYLHFWLLPFLVLGFLVSFFSSLGSAPKIDLPLSIFSLAKSVLTSLFSELTLLASETNTVILEEEILGKEKSYPNWEQFLGWKSSPIELLLKTAPPQTSWSFQPRNCSQIAVFQWSD